MPSSCFLTLGRRITPGWTGMAGKKKKNKKNCIGTVTILNHTDSKNILNTFQN